jgi:hypothetical protein
MSKLVVVVVCTVLFTFATASAQQGRPVDPATAASVRRLLTLTGAARLSVTAMEAMIPAQRAANPQIPGAFWDAFLAHARRDTTQLINLLIPIYAAHLTRPELEELVRFYSSPLGRRLAAAQPAITQESILAGQTWGAAIGKQVADSLSAAGVKPPQE